MIHKSDWSRQLAVGVLAAAVAVATGCSSGATTSGASSTTTAASSDSSTSVAGDSTTVAGATTIAPPPTIAGATTTIPPEPLILRVDGLGPFDFGSAPTSVLDAITAQLGAFASSEVATYETPEVEIYRDFDSGTGLGFRYPVGQTTCWSGEFCAEFGGASEAAMAFVGWSYTGPPHMLASSSNLTIGAKWGDFPSMVVFPTCYSTGGGTHHGIYVDLTVAGGWEWLVSDGAGGFVDNLPDPENTRVSFMSAGDNPFEPEDDC